MGALSRDRVGAEGFLGGVGQVEEAVGIVVFAVDLEHRLGERRHASVVHDEEDGLRRRQSQSIPKLFLKN